MRIVILGPGRLGSALAGFLVNAGHEVMLTGYRDEEKCFRLADALGCRLGDLERAREFGEVYFLCVPHEAAAATVRALRAPRGVLIDCTNQFGGEVPEDFDSTTEYLANLTSAMVVVKAFNTLRVNDLLSHAGADTPVAMVYATDSEAAAGIADTLIRDCGYAPLNLGPLANGVLQEPGGPFFLQVLDIDAAIRMARDIESTAGYMPAPPPY